MNVLEKVANQTSVDQRYSSDEQLVNFSEHSFERIPHQDYPN